MNYQLFQYHKIKIASFVNEKQLSISVLLIYIIKMNIKTSSLEEYVNFVDTTKKQNKYFKIFIFLIAIIISLFLFFLLFKYLNDEQFLITTNI